MMSKLSNANKSSFIKEPCIMIFGKLLIVKGYEIIFKFLLKLRNYITLVEIGEFNEWAPYKCRLTETGSRKLYDICSTLYKI